MPKLHRQIVLNLLLFLRKKSYFKKIIITFLVSVHNHSYHFISFFASSQNYHPKHDIINYKKFFTDHIKPTDRVLDVGCGSGLVSFAAAQKAKHVTGIDISAQNIAKAKKQYHLPNLDFIKTDATTHQFNNTFDIIILSNALEHIEHRVLFLQKLSKLAPTILIRVPIITRDWISVYKKKQGLEYLLDKTHYIEYTEKTFRREITNSKLTISHLHINFGEIYAIAQTINDAC